jgi:hypothetical protein
MHEVLRIAAAAGITLVVIGLSILFFEWVFLTAQREGGASREPPPGRKVDRDRDRHDSEIETTHRPLSMPMPNPSRHRDLL